MQIIQIHIITYRFISVTIENALRKSRIFIFPWNCNYTSLKDAFGEYRGKVFIENIKEEVSEELNICESHMSVMVELVLHGKKVKAQITRAIYHLVDPSKNKIFIAFDNEHCHKCDIGSWSNKKLTKRVKQLKDDYKKEQKRSYQAIAEEIEGPPSKRQKRQNLEDTDEDQDDPKKSNTNNGKKKDGYFEKLWMNNLKILTDKHGDKINGKGICELNKRHTNAMMKDEAIDVNTIPADILANFAIKKPVYTSSTSHYNAAPPSFPTSYPYPFPYGFPYGFPAHNAGQVIGGQSRSFYPPPPEAPAQPQINENAKSSKSPIEDEDEVIPLPINNDNEQEQ